MAPAVTNQRRPRVYQKKVQEGTVNDRDIQTFFGRQTSIMIVHSHLFLTNHVRAFDIMVSVHGGAEIQPAGAIRHSITRALIDYDEPQKPAPEPGWLRDHDAREVGRKRKSCVQHAVANSSASVIRLLLPKPPWCKPGGFS
jgi:small subunit ribosomal protein S9